MPLYVVKRHVIYGSQSQNEREVWGIDRSAAGLQTICAPHDTDKDDPLRKDCGTLLLKIGHEFVTWDRMFEWLSLAESAGYTVVSGFKNMSPYSQIVIRGP
jgi:hypothetical protein